jgi:hypothetical protein
MSAATVPNMGITSTAWSASGSNAMEIHGGRPFMVFPSHATPVICEGSRDGLPISHEWENLCGQKWLRYELPGTVSQGTQGCVEETINVQVRELTESGMRLTARISGQIPKIPRQKNSIIGSQTDTDGSPSAIWGNCSQAVDQLIDCHIDLMSSIAELAQSRNDGEDEAQNAGDVCLTRTSTVARLWSVSADSLNPRMSLIVKLARDIGETLQSVCANPRRVLRRERQFQRLDRVREVDGGCLRWLARQPGMTVAEKAGTRQECLSIARVENIDTLENRVVRDLLLRASHACNKYLREHRQARSHQRVDSVTKFRSLISGLLKSSPISGVSELSAVPNPNYVLQMDERYSVLWDAYQLLVRQQMLEDNVWRWRHRLFSEHVQLALISVLQHVCSSELTHGGDVLVRREQNAGQFIDPRTTLGPWIVPGSELTSIDLVKGDQLELHPLLPKSLGRSGPDFVLVKRVRREIQKILCCWTILDFGVSENANQSQREQFVEAAGIWSHDFQWSGILIKPALPHSGEPEETDEAYSSPCLVENISDALKVLRLRIPLQKSGYHFREHIKWGLKIN